MKREGEKKERCYVCGNPAEHERLLISVKAAARLCRVSPATIYRWMYCGQVQWVRLPFGRRRVYLDSLFCDRPRRTQTLP
jgi:hypothetical protein